MPMSVKICCEDFHFKKMRPEKKEKKKLFPKWIMVISMLNETGVQSSISDSVPFTF